MVQSDFDASAIALVNALQLLHQRLTPPCIDVTRTAASLLRQRRSADAEH